MTAYPSTRIGKKSFVCDLVSGSEGEKMREKDGEYSLRFSHLIGDIGKRASR